MLKKFLSLSNVTLIVALAISTIAAYYSIIGLTAIYAGAFIPIIIMGTILEIGKITTTVWLRKYWHRCGLALKLYLVPAVVLLAFLTSMGIFGFLSRAHIEQGVPTSDIAAKVQILDEKILTEREKIDAARQTLTQLDAQVNARLDRGQDARGAERAVTIRRQQVKERGQLRLEIEQAQTAIAKLNEERAPIASQLRKVEAEVGPIKYIAAIIYGDNPDQNLLEKAVRWVTILLVIVFDPLAIALVLAAHQSKDWDKEQPEYEPDDGPLTEDQLDQIRNSVDLPVKDKKPEVVEEPPKPVTTTVPIISEQTPEEDEAFELLDSKLNKPISQDPHIEGWMFPSNTTTLPIVEEPVVVEQPTVEPVIEPEPVIKTAGPNIEVIDHEYVLIDGKLMHRRTIDDQLLLQVDGNAPVSSFGTEFPKHANVGSSFVRIDVLPHKVYKYNGARWIEANKTSDAYLTDEYVEFLCNKIAAGELDIDALTLVEQDAVEQFLRNKTA